MDCFFCRRQREDQTSVASVHGRKSEDVPQEGAVSRRIIAVHDHMRTLTTAFESSSAAEAALEDSSEVPQVWRLRSEGFWTSHKGSSVDFLGDGTIFWGDGTRIQAFSGGSRRVHEQFRWNEAQRGTPRPGGALGSEVVGMETAFVTGRRDRRRP